jgi:hypothetical protein
MPPARAKARGRGLESAMASSFRRAVIAMVAGAPLSGCGFLFPELDFPIDVIEQMMFGPVLAEKRVDGVDRYGGEQGMHCTGGRYAGGGGDASVKDAKDGLKKEIDRLKNQIKELERQDDRCKGKSTPSGDYERQHGCDRAQTVALSRAAFQANATDAAVDGYEAAERSCTAASQAEQQDPCSQSNGAARPSLRRDRAEKLRDAEQRLARFEECNKDRERQTGVQQGPTVSPGFVITPGMFGRPPSQKHEQPSSRPPPRQTAPTHKKE